MWNKIPKETTDNFRMISINAPPSPLIEQWNKKSKLPYELIKSLSNVIRLFEYISFGYKLKTDKV